MKAKQLLAGVVLVGVMAMGAGYASWTKDMTASANVGTGSINYSISAPETSLSDNSKGYTWSKATVVGENVIQLNVNKIYPGVSLAYRFEIKNTGTSPIELLGGTSVDAGGFQNDNGITFTYSPVEGDTMVINPGDKKTFDVIIDASKDGSDIKQDTGSSFRQELHFRTLLPGEI